MMEHSSEDLRYPVGQFRWDEDSSDTARARRIGEIAATPSWLREAVAALSDEQLDTPYRPGGWTVRQVVHHVPDSHMNSYVRFRLALTENEPVIKPYEESLWAQLPDARSAPIRVSLDLLEALHERWVTLLRSLSGAEFRRQFRHPELGVVSLDKNLALYAWHGKHHVAHIANLRQRMNWK